MEAGSIPLSLHFLYFPNSDEFLQRYRKKLEEVRSRNFKDTNYGVEEERAFKYVSKTRHAFFDEICIIERTEEPRQQYVWKEFFFEDKQQLFEMMAICELRRELDADRCLGLTPVFRYMYRRVAHGWISSRFRIRVLLEWVKAPTIADKIAKTDEKEATVFLRRLFIGCLKILDCLHREDIFIIDLRPEYITYDESNQEHPFRLMDRLVDGVDPIKRITQSRSRNWTSYCHSMIWDVYVKQVQEIPRNNNRQLLTNMDIYALAMIVVQLGIKKDFSFLYVFNGRFNSVLFETYLNQFVKDREVEDASLCNCLSSILLSTKVTEGSSAIEHINTLERSPSQPRQETPRPASNPLITTLNQPPQDNRLPDNIANQTPADIPQNRQPQEEPPNQADGPIIPAELSQQPKDVSSKQNIAPETPSSGERAGRELLQSMNPVSRQPVNQTQSEPTRPNSMNMTDPRGQAPLASQNRDPLDTEQIKLLPPTTGTDRPITSNGTNESAPPANLPNTPQKKLPENIVKPAADGKERSGCPCCSLI